MTNLWDLLERNILSHFPFSELIYLKEFISETEFWHFLRSRILQTLSHGGDFSWLFQEGFCISMILKRCTVPPLGAWKFTSTNSAVNTPVNHRGSLLQIIWAQYTYPKRTLSRVLQKSIPLTTSRGKIAAGMKTKRFRHSQSTNLDICQISNYHFWLMVE